MRKHQKGSSSEEEEETDEDEPEIKKLSLSTKAMFKRELYNFCRSHKFL